MAKNKKDRLPASEPEWIEGDSTPPSFSSSELDELMEHRCSRCNKVTDKLYRMGTAALPMTICSACRSEFVGE